MPSRDTTPIGAPCWVDLMTSDPAKSTAFYTELFGWEAQDANPEFGGYFNFSKNGTLVAGAMPRMPDTPTELPDVWSVYLATDDARKTVDAAAADGAQVVAPAMDVADLGTMGVLVDPTGATIGLWQPGTHKGFGIVAEHGAPSWFELHTRDYEKALDFYRNVFRWDTRTESDTPEFRYTTLVNGDEQYAGVMDDSGHVPEGVPPHWAVYFGTDDADDTLAKINELGGSTVMPAQDTPYGRLAVATDVTGAQFSLVSPKLAD